MGYPDKTCISAPKFTSTFRIVSGLKGIQIPVQWQEQLPQSFDLEYTDPPNITLTFLAYCHWRQFCLQVGLSLFTSGWYQPGRFSIDAPNLEQASLPIGCSLHRCRFPKRSPSISPETPKKWTAFDKRDQEMFSESFSCVPITVCLVVSSCLIEDMGLRAMSWWENSVWRIQDTLDCASLRFAGNTLSRCKFMIVHVSAEA